MTNEIQLVQVPFYGDVIEAAQVDGKRFVSIRRCCESIGIDPSRQIRKLQDASWATVDMMSSIAPDGSRREHAMLDVESVPKWLGEINTRKVKIEVRAKLDLYQREVKHVLAAHFLGSEPIIEKFRLDADEKKMVRDDGKKARKGLTGFIARSCPGNPMAYPAITNSGYQGHFGATASEERKKRGLSKGANLREKLTTSELIVTLAYEHATTVLGTERNIQGVSAICDMNRNNASVYAKALADANKLIGLEQGAAS